MTMNEIMISTKNIIHWYNYYCGDLDRIEYVEKAILALKVLKTKQVDVFRLMDEEYVARYNERAGDNELTNLEFKLLKEVLQDTESLSVEEFDTIKEQLEYQNIEGKNMQSFIDFFDWCDSDRIEVRDEAFKKIKKNCSSHKAIVKRNKRKKRNRRR